MKPPARVTNTSIDQSEIILSIENISKIYTAQNWLGKSGRTTHAVNDVSLKLIKGNTLGIVRESGSGKSTLARILMGLVTPERGNLILSGQPMLIKGAALRRIRRIRSGASAQTTRKSESKARLIHHIYYT